MLSSSGRTCCWTGNGADTSTTVVKAGDKDL